jgi:hypothetical protein
MTNMTNDLARMHQRARIAETMRYLEALREIWPTLTQDELSVLRQEWRPLVPLVRVVLADRIVAIDRSYDRDALLALWTNAELADEFSELITLTSEEEQP